MMKRIECPFCGEEWYIFGQETTFTPSTVITCPNCGTSALLSRLSKYTSLTAQKVINMKEADYE